MKLAAPPILPKSLKSRFSLWNILFFLLGLAILVFLLLKIDFHSLVQLIGKIHWQYLALGAVAYLCKGTLRSFRFYRLNRRSQPSYVRMLRLTFASSLASQILPLKLGELSYVYLLKRDHEAPISQGLSTLLVVRLFDLLAISILFIAIAFIAQVPAGLSVYFYSILAFIGALVLLLIALLVLANFAQPVLNFFFGHAWVQKIPLADKLRRMTENIFTDLKQYRPMEYGEMVATACAEWLVNYATFQVMLIGMGLTPSFFATVVAVTFAALASVLPINSFGNFGTQEAGWATGLVLLGFTQSLALTSGFGTHLLTLGYMLVFGGLSWLSYLFTHKQAAPQSEL